MTDDAWKKMEGAKEGQYFETESKKAIEKLAKMDSDKPKLSPVSGKPMKTMTILGVEVDYCQETGGIFLEKGELDQIIKMAGEEEGGSWLTTLFNSLQIKLP